MGGYGIYLGENFVSCSSRKHVAARSIIESKDWALSIGAAEVAWV